MTESRASRDASGHRDVLDQLEPPDAEDSPLPFWERGELLDLPLGPPAKS